MDKLQIEKDKLKRVMGDNFDTEKLKAKFDTSNFDFNAVLRGMQLTLVGGMLSSVLKSTTDLDDSPPRATEPSYVHQ